MTLTICILIILNMKCLTKHLKNTLTLMNSRKNTFCGISEYFSMPPSIAITQD